MAQGEQWYYLDDGSDLGMVAWKDTLFNDYNWGLGKAPLGYGDPVATTLSYGGDASFRDQFSDSDGISVKMRTGSPVAPNNDIPVSKRQARPPVWSRRWGRR